MQKEDTAGALIDIKCYHKVRLGSYIVENAKIRYGQGTAGLLFCSKRKSKVRLSFFTENAEIAYCLGFSLLKMLK